MSMGNELGDGSDPYLHYLVNYLQEADSRRLYTSTTHPPNLARSDDYFVGASTDRGAVRGHRPFGDFRTALAHYDRPVIAHEVGQPAMYPNFAEIAKYSGHLRPHNIELFRKTLETNGMSTLAEPFRRASGALLVPVYKENIESQLRTPNIAGFQLLGLQDFPGHGTAPIGVLDVFYESKGLITPEAFRCFCGPTVPLLRTRGFIWTTDETLKVSAELSHYGPHDLARVTPRWAIRNDSGDPLATGTLDPLDVPTGVLAPLGDIEMPLDDIAAPCRLTIEITVPGVPAANAWHLWVYPRQVDIEPPGDVLVATVWDDRTREALVTGQKVLLIPGRNSLQHAVSSRWHPVFWSWQLFPQQPQVMGILCKPNHPALAAFPTDDHADWQWRGLLDRSQALLLEGVANALDPIVQFVPDMNLNKKLGAVFEVQVGTGRLLVSMVDLQSEMDRRPAARQLLHSLLTYMQSDRFQPQQTLSIDALDVLLQPPVKPESRGAPTNLDAAVLHIRAAANVPLLKPGSWQPSADQQIALAEGFDYNLQGGTWRDNISSAWHSTHLIVTVTCPPGFEGTFYAHLHDWNNEGRAAALFFDGRDLGPLSTYARDGFWLGLPVTAEQSVDGRLVLDVRATNGPNAVISQIVLVPKQ